MGLDLLLLHVTTEPRSVADIHNDDVVPLGACDEVAARLSAAFPGAEVVERRITAFGRERVVWEGTLWGDSSVVVQVSLSGSGADPDLCVAVKVEILRVPAIATPVSGLRSTVRVRSKRALEDVDAVTDVLRRLQQATGGALFLMHDGEPRLELARAVITRLLEEV